MTDHVITRVEEVTVEWLTAVLAAGPALTQGTVIAFESDGGRGNWSTNTSLTVKYSDDARGELPGKLFLKMVNTDIGDDESFGGSEVVYYTRDYVDVPDAPLLRCYDGAYSETQQRYHLLLEDVSASHVEASQKEPTREYGLALAEGLAAMHARWWGARRLAEAEAPIHNAGHIQRFVNIAEPGIGHILNHFSGEFESHWPDLLRTLYIRHPRVIIKRTQDDNGFTLIHGDAGHNNILVPRVGDRPIYIIDRQPFDWSLTTWLGAYDLAYAIVLDWETEIRRQHEIPILKQYHAQLIKNGILNYSWEQLYDDYRLCVAMGVYIASEYCRGGVNKRWIHVWLMMLRRTLIACDDLDCTALW